MRKIKLVISTIIIVSMVASLCQTALCAEVVNKDIALFLGSPKAYVKGQIVKIDLNDSKITPITISDRTVVPVRFITESLGAKVSFDEVTSEVSITLGSKIIKMKLNSDIMYVNEKEIKLEVPAQTINDRTFIPLRAIGEVIGKIVFWDKRGLIILTDKKVDEKSREAELKELIFKLSGDYYNDFDLTRDKVDFDEVKQEAFEKYIVPTAEQIADDIKAKNPNNRHPRLLADQNRFDFLKASVENNVEPYASWYKKIKVKADGELKYTVPEYTASMIIGGSMWYRFIELGIAWKISGDKVYAAKAYEFMETVANYEKWSATQYLESANIIASMGVAYDWFYDYMNEDQRAFICDAIATKGLEYSLTQYAGSYAFWWKQENNWNGVCNGGNGIAALAICSEMPELASQVLQKTFEGLPYYLKLFEPDGQSVEGVTYWNYGLTMWTNNYMSALSTALGTDYGYYDTNGMKKTGYYVASLTGPVATFWMHDDSGNGGKGIYSPPGLLWFADRYNDRNLTAYRKSTMTDPDVFDFIWYNNDHMKDSQEVELKPDSYMRDFETVTFRGSWNDQNTTFVGFHSGNNHSSHATLNMGTFNLQALGEEWAFNLGRDDYSKPGYFNMLPLYEQSGLGVIGRWNFYRMRAEGVNTLVINPCEYPDQDERALTYMDKVVSKPKGAFAVANMTEAYNRDAELINRGVMLTHNREWVVIQDEIKTKTPSQIYWFMHTKANVDVNKDGKTAALTIGNKKLLAVLQSPDNGKFSVMDAVPLAESPSDGIQNDPNLGVRKLTVKLDNASDTKISVLFVPMQGRDVIVPKDMPPVTPLSEWNIEDGSILDAVKRPKLTEIKINDVSLANFQPNKYDYSSTLPFDFDGLPKIEALSNAEVKVNAIEGLNPSYSIDVVDKNNADNKSFYYIDFIPGSKVGLPQDAKERKIISTAVEKEPVEAKYGSDNVIDGDLGAESRWSSEGLGQWIVLGMSSAQTVDYLSAAWVSGEQRSTFFEVQTSLDGVKWQTVAKTQSSGTVSGMETYKLKSTKAKFVKLICNGNTVSKWNSISELKLFGK